MAEKISVLLVDDHVLVRQGIRRFLEGTGDIQVLAEAGDGQEALRMLAQFQPDVVLLDIHMPVMNGLEAARRIRADYPQVRILILTADDDDPQVFSSLEAGVDGYVLKTSHVEELIRAVYAVGAGNVALSPQIATKVVRRMTSEPLTPDAGSVAPVERLSARELEVLRLAARGMTNREIGQALSISHRTVQGHLANLYSKLGVSSRTEAVTEALRLGWINFA